MNEKNNITIPEDNTTIRTIVIGKQVWMAENLSVAKFRNGDLIPEVKTDDEWMMAGVEGKPAWCYYNNIESLGKVYNWFAINDERGLAPIGWRIAGKKDIEELSDQLNSELQKDNNDSNVLSFLINQWKQSCYRNKLGTWTSTDEQLQFWCSFTDENSNVFSGIFNKITNKTCLQTADKKDGYFVRCIQGEVFSSKYKQLEPSNIKILDSLKSIAIGKQIWQVENLNVSRFRNGDLILKAKTEEEWRNAEIQEKPAWCYYNNDPEIGRIFGKLYNGYAITDSRGLAPTGWRIPDTNDWDVLLNALGGETDTVQKLKSVIGWNNDENGNNQSGFTGIPTGARSIYTGNFETFGHIAYWWCLSSDDATIKNNLKATSLGVGKSVYLDAKKFHQAPFAKMGMGYSVRCIKEANLTATIQENDDQNVTIQTVQIGSQIWMTNNLSRSRFRNGDSIYQTKSKADWVLAGNNKTPAWCYYNFEEDLGEKYGKIYNRFAIHDSRGLAPESWHIPANVEWLDLLEYIGWENEPHKKLISKTASNSKYVFNNETGFSAQPSGAFFEENGFGKTQFLFSWWTTSIKNSETFENTESYYRFEILLKENISSEFIFSNKLDGFYVRCVKNEEDLFSIKDSITDIENNQYKTISFGEQTWMAENLKVGKFRNGESILFARTRSEWLNANKQGIPACCNYDFHPKYGRLYGRLYNYFAICDPRGLAPFGWIIPDDLDWMYLIGTLEKQYGQLYTSRMKSEKGWKYELSGTNKTHFAAMPGGWCDENGQSKEALIDATWWSATNDASGLVYYWNLFYQRGYLIRFGSNKECGFSVRCIKDEALPKG